MTKKLLVVFMIENYKRLNYDIKSVHTIRRIKVLVTILK